MQCTDKNNSLQYDLNIKKFQRKIWKTIGLCLYIVYCGGFSNITNLVVVVCFTVRNAKIIKCIKFKRNYLSISIHNICDAQWPNKKIIHYQYPADTT